ncbi:hypothetical protein V2G26_016076 [Clonostachys chloroleuca]
MLHYESNTIIDKYLPSIHNILIGLNAKADKRKPSKGHRMAIGRSTIQVSSDRPGPPERSSHISNVPKSQPGETRCALQQKHCSQAPVAA